MVRSARVGLHRHLEQEGVPPAVLDGVLLVASELTTNAVLHGAPPIELGARVAPHVVRVEVADGSPNLPHPRHYGTAAVTGRGLAIVAVLSDSWGAFEHPNGKTVWAEMAASGAAAGTAESAAPQGRPGSVPGHLASRPPTEELQGWWENSATAGAVPIVYRGVPVDVYLELQEIADGLAREAQFATAEGQPAPGDEPVPGLAELLGALRSALSHPPERMRAEVLAAKERGDRTVDLTVDAAPDALDASTRHVELLERADEFARAGALLVGPASPAVAELRRWFVDELRRQLP
jgi:hypothetical protein